MPLTPIGSVGSQLERAIVAYLIGQGCGDSTNTFSAYVTSIKNYPVTIVQATESQHLQSTGNEAYEVQVICRQNAVNAVGETNPDTKRVALENKIGLCHAAMVKAPSDGFQDLTAACSAITSAGRALASNSDATIAANNADMAEFTLQFMNYSGASRGKPEPEGAAWQEVRHFVCQACAKALTM